MADGFQTFHDRAAEFAAQMGYTPMEDGRYMAPDGESFIGANEMRQMADQFFGPDADPLIGGQQFRSVPSDAQSMAQLQSMGLNVQQHPEYGAIAPDDASYAAAFPGRATSSIFDYGPFILGGGMAALAAGAGGLGAGALASGGETGAVAAGSNVPSAVGGWTGSGAFPTGGMSTVTQAFNPVTGVFEAVGGPMSTTAALQSSIASGGFAGGMAGGLAGFVPAQAGTSGATNMADFSLEDYLATQAADDMAAGVGATQSAADAGINLSGGIMQQLVDAGVPWEVVSAASSSPSTIAKLAKTALGIGGSSNPAANKSGLPDWLNQLLPNATAGSLLGGLFQAGLGIAGSNAQAEALQNLTNQQAGNFAQGTQAYYDAVNRQTGAYGEATGAYKERTAAQQKAYEDQTGQYKSLLDLQRGAYGDQKSAYDANFAAQQKAYQDQTGQYNSLMDLQKGAYGNSMDAYNANVAAQNKAYQDQQAAYGNVLDLQKSAYGDQKSAYNANVAAQNQAYQDQRGDYANLLGLQQGAYGDQKAAYDANVAAQKASYDTSLGLFDTQNQQQMAAYGDRTAQYNAERARQTALGQPYRDTLAGLYADPNSFLTSKEVQVPVQQASDIMARSLSTKGNPFGSGNALQQLQSYSADQLFGKLGEEKNRLGTLGGLTGAAYQGPASPQGPAAMQAFPSLQNQGPLSTPNYSQNFPTFTSPGNMPAPSYSQNFPTFTSAGQAPTPSYSQNFPTFSSPGQAPSANYSQNFPQLGTPGNFPTMPNPPQFPNQDWGAATALAGNTSNMWNSIGSGVSAAVNPPTTLAQLLAQMKIA